MSLLVKLIDHNHQVDATATLEQALEQFALHGYEFMAVIDQSKVIGLCCRENLGTLLGTKYGFSLFAQKPLLEHLRPTPIFLGQKTPLTEVFERVFNRPSEIFFDDVVVMGPHGECLGLICTQTLVKLQNQIHLDNIELLEKQQRDITLRSRQMESDLRLSGELQIALLPETYPAFQGTHQNPPLFQFHHLYSSLEVVGGDFFHVQKISDVKAGVFMADVMGHGIRSALITGMLRALLEEMGPKFESPGALMTSLNRELASILDNGQHDVVYATGLYMTLDGSSRTAQMSVGAHPFPILVRRSESRVESLHRDQVGTLLGIFPDLEFGESQSDLMEDDTLLLFTDGIFEVENPEGQPFGLSGMMDVIENHLDLSTSQLLERIHTAALKHAALQTLSDDACLLAIDYRPSR